MQPWADAALARAANVPRPLGVSLRTAGQLAEGACQLALLEEAVSVLEHAPARLEHARALVELGAALRRKTVEMHLGRSYRKLNVSGREALPRTLTGEAAS